MVKQRQGNRYIKQQHDKKGRPICLIIGCDKICQQYKNGRYRNYCKNHNCWDLRGIINWQDFRKKALKRDNYTCVKCGDNRESIISEVMRTFYEWEGKQFSGKLIPEKRLVKESKNNFIVDHIEPIALGGDEWDLDNLQTLCLKCNKIKTRKDAKKIAELRRTEKVLVKAKRY